MTNALTLILLAASSSSTDAGPVDTAVGLGRQKRPTAIATIAGQRLTGPTESATLSTKKRPAGSVAIDFPAARSATGPQALRLMTSRERILRRRRASRAALQGGQQQTMGELISLIQSTVAPDCWELSGGGFSGFGSAGSGNNAGSGRQNAENLIELIQQTVSPSSWEINGGSGSISIFP